MRGFKQVLGEHAKHNQKSHAGGRGGAKKVSAAQKNRNTAAKKLTEPKNANTASNALVKHFGGRKGRGGGGPLSASSTVRGLVDSKRGSIEKTLRQAGFSFKSSHSGFGRGGDALSITPFDNKKGLSGDITKERGTKHFSVSFNHRPSSVAATRAARSKLDLPYYD